MKVVPLVVLAMVALVLGIGAGLVRLGWMVPMPMDAIAVHGMLMVSGFFGTVIGLERAVVGGARWAYAGPALSGAGAIALASGVRAAPLLFALAGAIALAVVVGKPSLHKTTMALGAAAWLGSSVLALFGAPAMRLVPWWFGFLVLTIAGERLERAARARGTFAIAVAILIAGIVSGSMRVFGAGLLALALWLAVYDVARASIGARGLPRFVAIGLLSGYAWLGVSGAIFALATAIGPGSAAWDAALHTLALGFVFSMVIAHAPMIAPRIAGRPVPFRAVFHVPLVLLHASLALRIAGDATATYAWRAAGGLGNAIAIGAFVVTLIGTITSAGARRRSRERFHSMQESSR